MKSLTFDPRPMDQLDCGPQPFCPEWLWEGFLARGNITLLTSAWKSGKTTLLAGLLRSLGSGNAFLDSHCNQGKAVVVSEELPLHWKARQRAIPIGSHVRLVSRPFVGRPTPKQWDELIHLAEEERGRGALDVFVVDSLAAFLPGRSDSDPGTLLEMLHPLRRLAELGVAVLILHHPRKEAAEDGSKARGSGALLGFVDVILELDRLSRLPTDSCRRKLLVLSRHPVTPPSVVYQWQPGTAEFHTVANVPATRFRENWPVLETILKGRQSAATHRELLADWPPDRDAPTERQLYQWLASAADENLVVRTGRGTKNRPYRFRLKRAGDPSQLDNVPELDKLDVDNPYDGMSEEEQMRELDRIEKILLGGKQPRSPQVGM